MAHRRGYKVSLMDEMPGEIVGIKVLLPTIFRIIYLKIILQFSTKVFRIWLMNFFCIFIVILTFFYLFSIEHIQIFNEKELGRMFC